MMKEEIEAKLVELEAKAQSEVESASFKIKTIQDRVAKVVDPIFEECMELERELYDGKTRIEVFTETGVDPKTGKTRAELMGEMFSSLLSGMSGEQGMDGPFGG